MTPEAQRVAIAEACGWKGIRQSRRWELSDDPACPQDLCGRHPVEDYWSHLPDYLPDLNAIHEAEKVLTNEQRRAYARMLIQVHPLKYDPTNPGPFCQDGGAMNLFLIASMTAAQRAEAFLKTLGLWDDSK